MNLLPQAAIDTAYKSFGDLADTFHRDQVVVVRRVRAAALFNDSQAAATKPTSTEFRGMNVPDKRPVMEEQQGASDLTGGYVLVNVEEMQRAGLADSHGLLLINEATDTITINGGKELRLDKVASLGPLGGKMAVAKLFYSQELARPRS